MNDNVEIIRSNKGGMKIIHRGYMYTVHKKRQGGGIRWRCTQRSLHCKGSISTGNGPPSVNMPHNHIPDPHSVALARCRQLEEFPDIASLLETEYDEIKESIPDSMPLQQRMLLSPPQVQIPSSESLLQSQPLSPTKLKVTRQSTKLQSFTPKVETPAIIPAEEVCLRWNSHHSNMQTSFPQLLEKEQFVDVTLVAEEKTLKCHRIILSSCSAYFEEILNGITPLQHPVVILKGIPFWILKALTDFMYVGEVNIDQNKLPELLDVAELLKVKGLAGKSNSSSSDNRKPESQPAKKMHVKDAPPRHPAARNPPQAAPVVAKVEEMPISDPLELLEPRFHDDSDGSSSRTKENRLLSRRILTRKIRKRKSSEDEPALPLFPMRRGTRSRPNVKVPKYYDYEDIVKPSSSDAQSLSPNVTIKSEPVDVEENDVYTESGESSLNTSTETVGPRISTPSKPPEERSRASESPPLKSSKSATREKQQMPLMYKIKIKSFSSLSEKSNCKPAGDDVSGEENVNSAGNKPADLVESSDSAVACDILNDSEVESLVEPSVAGESNDLKAQDGTNGDEAPVSEKETVEVDTSQPEQVEESLNASDQHTADSTEKTDVDN